MRLLGISTYLCPEYIFQIRSLKGSLPCDILAVVDTHPNEMQILLLEKIMKALPISSYALLEIKNPDKSNWIFQRLCQDKLAKRFLIFWECPTALLQDPLFLQTFPLKQLIQGPCVIEKKRKLWQNLKIWMKQ